MNYPQIFLGPYAFLIGIAFWPGMASASLVPRWGLIALSAALIVPQSRFMTVSRLLGILFLAWCVPYAVWNVSGVDGVGALWRLVLLAAVFELGAQVNPVPAYVGMALAVWITSGLAIAQFEGVPWVLTWIKPWMTNTPAGLFVNSNTAAEISALVCVACATRRRLWWLIPGCLPTLWLAQSRGSVIAIAAAAFFYGLMYARKAAIGLLIVSIIVGVVAWWFGFKATSTNERLAIYLDLLQSMTLWGYGLGSFESAYPFIAQRIDTFRFHVEYAHSDLLQAVFELGIGSVLFFGFLAACIWWGYWGERLVLIAFVAEMAVGFPSHLPATAFLAALVAGRCSAGGPGVCDLLHGFRIHVQRLMDGGKPIYNHGCCAFQRIGLSIRAALSRRLCQPSGSADCI